MRHKLKKRAGGRPAEVSIHYEAFAGDAFVDADTNLDRLVAGLSEDAQDADVVVWDSIDRLAAVVLAGGVVQRFDNRTARESPVAEIAQPAQTGA